ncbi:hypothetical protein C8R45DRAFT_968202 [Mycena sanguinolenta]|nr:hypothetical protein C8R45DRAFT_968202 [Mycena sanguinolenta]
MNFRQDWLEACRHCRPSCDPPYHRKGNRQCPRCHTRPGVRHWDVHFVPTLRWATSVGQVVSFVFGATIWAVGLSWRRYREICLRTLCSIQCVLAVRTILRRRATYTGERFTKKTRGGYFRPCCWRGVQARHLRPSSGAGGCLYCHRVVLLIAAFCGLSIRSRATTSLGSGPCFGGTGS